MKLKCINLGALILILFCSISSSERLDASFVSPRDHDWRSKLTADELVEVQNRWKTILKFTKFPKYKTNEYPKQGMVKNEEMAIKLAELYWLSRYPKETVEFEKPFVAVLRDNKVWYVSGVLPPNYLGGTLEIAIQKMDGKIFWMEHGK